MLGRRRGRPSWRAARWVPNYHRPETPVDAHFANAGEPGLAAADTVEQYWTEFADPMLNSLVEDALAHNKDLSAAEANLQRRARRAATWPDSINIRRSRLAAATRTIWILRNNCRASISTTGSSTPHRPASTACGSSICSAASAAMSRRRAATWARARQRCRDARVSVIAEVARDYFILRGLQDQLALTQRNADNQFSSLKLTRTRLEAGRGNELDTSRAEAQWQTTLASIPTLEASIATTTYRLSVLTGRQPTALSAETLDAGADADLAAVERDRHAGATAAAQTRCARRGTAARRRHRAGRRGGRRPVSQGHLRRRGGLLCAHLRRFRAKRSAILFGRSEHLLGGL